MVSFKILKPKTFSSQQNHGKKIKWKNISDAFNKDPSVLLPRKAKDIKERWDNHLKKPFKTLKIY